MSLTTTAAPSRARHRANSLPMPRPAPVTTATRPSSNMRTSEEVGVGSGPRRRRPRIRIQATVRVGHRWPPLSYPHYADRRDDGHRCRCQGCRPLRRERGPGRAAPARPRGGRAGRSAPLARGLGRDRRAPVEAIKALAAADLFRVTIGEQWGGLGFGDVEAAIVLEEVARFDVSAAICCQLAFNGPSRGIEHLGSDAHEGPVAAARRRRRGHHQHRHHRARRRARPCRRCARALTADGARAVAAQRLQELLDPRPRCVRRAGLVPVAGRRRRQGHRRGRSIPMDRDGVSRHRAATRAWASTPRPRPRSRSTAWPSPRTTS